MPLRADSHPPRVRVEVGLGAASAIVVLLTAMYGL